MRTSSILGAWPVLFRHGYGGDVLTLGTQLAAARAESGLSLDDVALATRVRASVIFALECDDFSVLGPQVYAKGHLRTIANVIGLDPDLVVESFLSGVQTASG